MKKILENYKYKLLIIFTLSLVYTGANYYFEPFSKNNKNVALFPTFLLSITIVCFYVIPVIFLLRYLIRRLSVSRQAVAFSLILGFSICIFLGSEGNSLLSLILLSLKVPERVLVDWGASMTAPIAEELAKGFVVLLVYLLCKKMSLRTVFVCSLISGFCFQVLEDIFFIHAATFGNEISGYEQAFERVSYALGSHMVFTILFGVGLIVLIKKDTGITRGKAVFWMLSAVVLHFLWNAPFEEKWIIPVLGSIGLNLAYNVFTNIDRLDENDQVSSGVLC